MFNSAVFVLEALLLQFRNCNELDPGSLLLVGLYTCGGRCCVVLVEDWVEERCRLVAVVCSRVLFRDEDVFVVLPPALFSEISHATAATTPMNIRTPMSLAPLSGRWISHNVYEVAHTTHYDGARYTISDSARTDIKQFLHLSYNLRAFGCWQHTWLTYSN